MAQIRRKTYAAEARDYLVKAREMGISLSWNQYEAMLPQDGFARLGLACDCCLLGPCRIDPFSRSGVKTICGLDKEALVLRRMARLMDIPVEAACCADSLVALATEKALAGCEEGEIAAGSRQVGLGALQYSTINIVAEGLSLAQLKGLVQAAADLQSQAEAVGARGYHIALSGDVSPFIDLPVATPAGTVEFAILTGLVDGYIIGGDAPGIGRGAAGSFGTAVCAVGTNTDWTACLEAAAHAYQNRPEQVQVELEVHELAFSCPAAAAKVYDEVVILGGGSNLKQCVDDLVVKAAQQLAGTNVLVAAYGNAAVILAKYGVEADNIIACGSNASLAKAAEAFAGKTITALSPELLTGADVATAFALAAQGVSVFTATELPVEGCGELAQTLRQLVQFRDADAFKQLIKEMAAAKLAAE